VYVAGAFAVSDPGLSSADGGVAAVDAAAVEAATTSTARVVLSTRPDYRLPSSPMSRTGVGAWAPCNKPPTRERPFAGRFRYTCGAERLTQPRPTWRARLTAAFRREPPNKIARFRSAKSRGGGTRTPNPRFTEPGVHPAKRLSCARANPGSCSSPCSDAP
jgi:hypothetical protein